MAVTTLRARLPLVAAVLSALAALGASGTRVAAPPSEPATDWRPLFNGKDLSGWETWMSKPDSAWDVPGMARDAQGAYVEAVGLDRDPLGVFRVEAVDGEPAIHVSGQGFGVMTTRESFENFHLTLQFKWGEKRWGKKAKAPRDSGLLYFVHGNAGAVDGNWPRAVEMQIQEKDTGDLYALGTQITVRARRGSAAGRPAYLYDPEGEPIAFEQKPPTGNRCVKLEDREKPFGDWNSLELVVLADESIHVVNGAVVMRLANARRLDGAEPVPLKSGRISLQTEGAEVFYRHIEIRPITTVPADLASPTTAPARKP